MIVLGTLISILGTALLTGAVVYLTYTLTVSVIKKYKKRKSSKLMAAQVKDLIKKAPSMSLDDLEDDDVVLAEYDVEADELVQDIDIAKDVDNRVSDILNKNGGIVVFD